MASVQLFHNGIHHLQAGVDADAALAEFSEVVLKADPLRRRVVFAASAGQADMALAAEIAGFRPVFDVDVPGAELRLSVAEPVWVSNIDLQRLPGA